MVESLKGTWWSLALRGIVALVFGLLFLLWPGGMTEFTIKILFAIFCVVDGVSSVIGVLNKRSADGSWWLPMLEGLALILLGIVTFVWPGFTFFILVYFVAIRALLSGLFNVYMGVVLISAKASGWLPLLTGIVAIAFGLFVFFNPESIVTLLGILALFIGIVFIVLAFQVRSWTLEAVQ